MPWPETNVLEPGAEPVDAISLLRADMDEVDGAFAKFWDVSHDDDVEKRRTKIDAARDACHRTRVHLGLERAFLRAVEGTVSDETLLREMRISEGEALDLCAKIERVEPADRQYDVAVRVLGDFLLKRAAGEREGVFRHVAASRLDLFELAEQLRSTRAELMLAETAAAH
jgi:hypothetical protein